MNIETGKNGCTHFANPFWCDRDKVIGLKKGDASLNCLLVCFLHSLILHIFYLFYRKVCRRPAREVWMGELQWEWDCETISKSTFGRTVNVDCLGEMSEDVSNGSWGDTATLTPPPPLQGCHTSRYQVANGTALPVEEGASDGSEMISVLCSEHRASGRLSPACSDNSSGFECSDSDSFSATSSLTYHHDEKNW